MFFSHMNNIKSIICKTYISVSFHFLLLFRCFFNHTNSILIIILPILICITFILIFLLISRNYIKNLSNKTNEIFSNLISSNKQSSTMNYQYESMNQLVSILSQLILLMLLLLSSLIIYIHPLKYFQIKFENLIYSHFYGFFILFYSFYILSFYILSQINFIINYYLNRNKTDLLSNQSLKNHNTSSSFTEHISILPQSESHQYTCNISENSLTNNDDESNRLKRITNITSKYYLCYDHFIQNNSKDDIPYSTSDTNSQEYIIIFHLILFY